MLRKALGSFIENINWCIADSRKHVVPIKMPQTFLASTDYRTVRDKVSFQLPAMQLADKAQGLIANHGLQGLLDMLPSQSLFCQFLRPVLNTIAIAISKYLTQAPTCSHSPLRAHALIAAL